MSTDLPTGDQQTSGGLSTAALGWFRALESLPGLATPGDKLYFKLSLPPCRHPDQHIPRAKLLMSPSPSGSGALESRSCEGGWARSPPRSAPLSSGPTDPPNARQKINMKEFPTPKPLFQPERFAGEIKQGPGVYEH